ncbi:hypothetical protein [Prochlorococcus marinus]|uniref:hypothetical protein n=1 Tax=Prochlorococcus marinus TaxID=1219 RepID=UPI0022B50A4F|nr:hypothetical protein [Prochlorococcus marinus]
MFPLILFMWALDTKKTRINRYRSYCWSWKKIADVYESAQQQWIWHLGEDVIVALKSKHRPFVSSYRPSHLDPSFL